MKRNIPEVLTIEEQERFIAIFNIRYFNSLRNRTMVKLFLAAGLRLSEMINLKWKHINLQTGQLKVEKGKGSKDRILWVNEDVLGDLRMWRNVQFDKLGVAQFMFTTRDLKQIKSTDVREMIYKYSQKALGKRVNPHLLRHTFATDLLRETKNIRLVQKALGHEDLSTTMIYTHIVDDEMENAMKTFRLK